MMFPEEHSELEKQMGCMGGLLQIFDRGHFFSGKRFNRHAPKRLTSGKASLNEKERDKPVELKKSSQPTLEKSLSKSLTENSSLSMESSRASCSSSSCSSFSSANDAFYAEKPSKETLRPTSAPCYSEFRNIIKESINREPHNGLTLKTTKEEMPKKVLKHNDSPRPLLLSKSTDGTYVIGIDKSDYELKCNTYCTSRFSCDGRELPSHAQTGHKDSSRTSTGLRDLPRLSLDSRKESLKRSNSNSCGNYDSPGHRRSNSLIARLMGLDLFPDCAEDQNVSTVETSNPGESLRTRRDCCLSNFSKNDTRENDVKRNLANPSLVVKTKTPSRIGPESAPWMQHEKNDSRRMASEIERRLRELDLRAKERVQTSRGAESPRSFDSPVVIMKPAKYGKRAINTTTYQATPIAGDLTGSRTHSVCSPKARERNQGSKLRHENGASSPRTPRSRIISERQNDLLKNSRPSSPSSPKKNLVSDLGSTRRLKPKSLQSKSNSGQNSAEMGLVDPCIPHIKEKIPDKEMAVVSPISVLDPSFYNEEYTPVKRVTDSFRDGEICTSEESWNPASLPDTPPSNQIKSENIEILIQKLEQLSLVKDEQNCGEIVVLHNPENKDHEYIKEILAASGLLHKDLSSVVLPQQANCLINPDLFFVLEQTKSGNKVHRRLTFDLVNEIIGEKLEWSTSPMLHSELHIYTKKVGGEQLFKELCTEIDKIQMGVVKSTALDGADENEAENLEMSVEETFCQMRGWDKFESELQGMVLEIERSIFKDLVDEIIDPESSEVIKQRKIRRQLF